MHKRLDAEHGVICRLPGERLGYFGWPSVARLDDGTLLAVSSGLRSQHICPWGKTVLHVSTDDGHSWSAPRVIQDSPLDDRDAGVVDLGGGQLLGFHGSPPHLLRHSSGVLLLAYGYRQAPYGQRVAVSYDEGTTWDHDWIIRDDGPDSDLGYPASVELGDGSLFTVYYQRVPGDARCSLLCSRWTLP